MLDTTPGELRGRHVTSVNPEFDRDQFDAYFDSFEAGETREVEAHNRTLDGERTFPVIVTVTHTRIDGREYHVGNVTEISDRKRRERDLQLFREAVEQAGNTVFITDSDGPIELRVADDGPGIPPQEQAAVEIGTEGPLVHSSGIGLSHVHWVVTDYGGDITISDNEPRGTVVSLLLPSAGD